MTLDNISYELSTGNLVVRIGSATIPQLDVIEAAAKMAGKLSVSTGKASGGDNPVYPDVVVQGYFSDGRDAKRMAGGLLKILGALLTGESQEYR